MGRATIIIRGEADRHKAKHWIDMAPPDTRVEFKRSKRTIPQNDRMWEMLTRLSDRVLWHGKRMSPEDWKLVMLDGLKREVRAVPSIDGQGFVNLGQSSSDLSKEEMGDLMELIEAFTAQQGIDIWEDDNAV